jgi:aminoglycoside/choline kinase family phosphotransferase/GTP:adenosylcobinamide-phosphate guanylyltransferase
MKALILAAGLGTRLLPHTRRLPKPLFPISGRPLLALTIDRLKAAGCTEIIINTHHLAHLIENFILGRDHGIPIILRHEQKILGTGGAIRNVKDLLDHQPLIVINADIVSDIDMGALFEGHCRQAKPVTMALHHREPFNLVGVDRLERVVGFTNRGYTPSDDHQIMAFTGIQILNPKVVDWIPPKRYVDIIDVYNDHLVSAGKVRAAVMHGCRWSDIGTPASYRQAVLEQMIPRAFQAATGKRPDHHGSLDVSMQPLKGDGSDRRWYRLQRDDHSLILADHGIHSKNNIGEAGAFIAIGRHLKSKAVGVPRIWAGDPFSGLVFMEDLGHEHLQDSLRRQNQDRFSRRKHYQKIIDALLRLGLEAIHGFDPAWAYQTREYSRGVILEKECRYFMEAFVKGHLQWEFDDKVLMEEFHHLADMILENAIWGLIHRDMQSRNIMVHEGRFHFIDFQGARKGPIQYDLASLLIDPYVGLCETERETLLDDYCTRLFELGKKGPEIERVRVGYRFCAIARNLQILGAFGFLTHVKKKPWFMRYIPAAVATLRENLLAQGVFGFKHLKTLAKRIENTLCSDPKDPIC